MSDVLLDVWIPGRPRPQGALKTFAVAGKAYGRHTDSTLSHRAHVISTLAENWNLEPLTGAVAVDVVFTFARPKNHYGTGRNADVIKESAPEHHIQAPANSRSRVVRQPLGSSGGRSSADSAHTTRTLYRPPRYRRTTLSNSWKSSGFRFGIANSSVGNFGS